MQDLFRHEAQQNYQQYQFGLVIQSQPPLLRRLALLIALCLTISLIFLFFTDYHRKYRVTGFLDLQTGQKHLTASMSGVLIELTVTEGSTVIEGQMLAKIQSNKYLDIQQELHHTLQQKLQQRIDKTTQLHQVALAKHILHQNKLDTSIQNLNQQLNRHDKKLELLEERLQINRNITENLQALSGTGYISAIEKDKQIDSSLAIELQIESKHLSRLNLEKQKRLIETQIAQLPLQRQITIYQYDQQIAQLSQEMATLQSTTEQLILAPQAGVITNIMVEPKDQITIAQQLLTLIPKDPQLQAILQVPTAAYGFAQMGQKVRIRYDAFPYQRFGIHHGYISQLSKAIVLPQHVSDYPQQNHAFYRVVVNLERQYIEAYGHQLPLKPGMQLNADLLIEKHSLLTWLFAPIYAASGG